MIKLVDMLDSEGGERVLAGKTYRNTIFSDFTIRPPAQCVFILRDVIFENCKVSDGACVIRPNAVLDNVFFRNFESGAAMYISSEVIMRDVVIEGDERPKMLWIKPYVKAGVSPSKVPPGFCSLDISKYFGEVSITGISVDSVRINPGLHVKIRLESFERVDWQALGIGGLSYWRLMARKIRADGGSEGVFSLPPKTGRNFDKSMTELELLRECAALE